MLRIVSPVLVFSGIYAAIGAYFLFLFYRIPRLRSSHMIWFIVTCFIAAVYSGTRVGMYTAMAWDDLYFWIWVAHVIIPVLAITIAGFLSYYVKDEQQWIMKFFYSIFFIFAITVIFGGKYSIVLQNTITGQIETNTYIPRVKGELSNLAISLYGFLLFSVLYSLFHLFTWGIKGEKKEIITVICGVSVLFITVISDVAMSYKLISFIFVGEYGFFFLMLAMCYATINQIASQWQDLPDRTKTVASGNPDDLLKDVDTEFIKTKLLSLMHEEKLFSDENISLDVMANHFSLSSQKFSRFMNVIMGCDFRNFINQFRIKEAKRLLQTEPNLSIKEICYEVGFKSASAFHDAFKKFTGTSPAKFRKEVTE